MKFQISLDSLSEAINWVSKGLPQRPSMPILGGILIEGTESVTFSTFDYEISTKIDCKADVMETGTALVSGRILIDIVRSLPNRPVYVETNDNELNIKCGNANFSLPLMPEEDYPKLPDFPQTIGKVSGTEFAKSVLEVAISASKDDTLPMLTGIKCELTDDKFTLIATDKFRLSYKQLAWQPEIKEKVDILIPYRNLLEFAKNIVVDTDNEVVIAYNLNKASAKESIVGFKTNNKQLTTRVLDLEFPPAQKLLRNQHSTVVSVNIEELTSAIKRVSLLAERGVRIILDIKDNNLELKADSGNGKAVEIISLEQLGNDLTVAFNPTYLLDGLATFKTNQVMIGLQDFKQVAIFKPTDKKTSEIIIEEEEFVLPEEDLTYLLMPIRIN